MTAIALCAENRLNNAVKYAAVPSPTDGKSPIATNTIESRDSESHHAKDRTSEHLRSRQMKVADARAVVQKRQETVDILLEGDAMEGKPGIVLSRLDGTTLLIVATIRDGGWFTKTALRVGMTIVSINGVAMAGRAPSKVMRSLWTAMKEGRLCLRAGHHTPDDLPTTFPLVRDTLPILKKSIDSHCKIDQTNVGVGSEHLTRWMEMGRYSRVEVTVIKQSAEQKVGITFMRKGKNSPLVVKSICDKGLFHSTILCSGMVILKVNEKDATWLSPLEAASEIQNASAGRISVAAEGFFGSANISNSSDLPGINFESISGREGVFIESIDPTSPFGASDLRVGMQVILLNGMTCPMDAKDATELMALSLGHVEILGTFSFREGDHFTAHDEIEEYREETRLQKLGFRRRSRVAALREPERKENNAESSVVHVVLQEELRKPKPGILLLRKDGRLVVKEIRSEGWFDKTSLQLGMQILAINNESMAQKDVEYIFKRFQQAKKEGRMVLTARRGESAPVKRYSRVSSIVMKKSVNAKLGITFTRQNEQSPLTIKQIQRTGLFGGSLLQPGMALLKINGRSASWLSPEEAAAAIRHAPKGRVSITAEGYCASAYRTKRSEGFGLIVKNSSSKEGLYISEIKENSPFAFFNLEPGMQILLINGKPCPSNLKDAGKAMRKSPDRMEIVATLASDEGEKVTIDDLTKAKGDPILDQVCDCLVFDFV